MDCGKYREGNYFLLLECNMKLKKLHLISSLVALSVSVSAHASMAGLCNDYNNDGGTQYICCPQNGGWIVGSDCDSGAAEYCVNDTGTVMNDNPQVSILQDCINRGGSAVSYPFSTTKKLKK